MAQRQWLAQLLLVCTEKHHLIVYVFLDKKYLFICDYYYLNLNGVCRKEPMLAIVYNRVIFLIT